MFLLYGLHQIEIDKGNYALSMQDIDKSHKLLVAEKDNQIFELNKSLSNISHQQSLESEEARTLQVAALTEELAAAKSRAQAEVEALRADMASVTSANSKLQVGYLFLVIYSFYYSQNVLSIIAKQDLVSDLKRQVAAEQSQTQVRNHFLWSHFGCISWYLYL